MKNLPPIHYRIFPKSPEAHLFEVTCTVDDPDPEGKADDATLIWYTPLPGEVSVLQ